MDCGMNQKEEEPGKNQWNKTKAGLGAVPYQTTSVQFQTIPTNQQRCSGNILERDLGLLRGLMERWTGYCRYRRIKSSSDILSEFCMRPTKRSRLSAPRKFLGRGFLSSFLWDLYFRRRVLGKSP
ncbi:hypothetical protein Pcinc_040457 [Petrolisthes cinctipes]|uniref:Uncharacterized protein n=1 Tax=Petrolisthes cinctipes TaxID=88211 RepID=A0AAE1EI10_PETCI|nr:hypothetical protein Pcinc_040457 [Petrolisthes cinctipes]